MLMLLMLMRSARHRALSAGRLIMGASTAQQKSRGSARRRQSNVPHGTEAIPRFQPSAAALGAACAQQILDQFRKDLEGVDLKVKKTKPPQKQKRKKS